MEVITIGERIKNIRTARGLSQKALGDLCNPPIDSAAIRRLEKSESNPTIETINRVALALNIPASMLVSSYADKNPFEVRDKAVFLDLLLEKCDASLDGSDEAEGIVVLRHNGHYYELSTKDLEDLERIANNTADYFEYEFNKFLKRYGQ